MNSSPIKNKQRIVAIVQARMSSERLPGKILMSVNDKPILSYLMDRVGLCDELDDYIIATSDSDSDDDVEEFAENNSFSYYRGQLKDVAKRLINTAEYCNADAFVRISGDSPLIDYGTIDHLVGLYREHNNIDMVTNIQERTFPKGQSIEVINLSTLTEAYESGFNDYEREHVTPWFYKNKSRLNILNIKYEPPSGKMQLSIDTEDDMKKFEEIINILGKPYNIHHLDSIINAAEQCEQPSHEAT